ncbi:MAG: HipA domain-containing protein [Gammaproteobacteria bacterium]|nr:HipA domain-containing protein [Gammaproteobacteria bacterium]
MKYCPITFDIIRDNENYSRRGLHLLSPQLNHLAPLQLSASDQRMEAITRVGKMSIQGIQPKLSAQLKVKEGYFEIVDQNGRYILKPQNEYYPELPENEALTMSLAACIDIETPIHGLLYSIDGSMTYFVKRFDRAGHNKKIALEDFAQLSGMDRQTKYDSSMEKVIKVISEHCTFPKIEFVKFFRLTIFNFLIGNEDMHLKNFSLISRDQKITLSPSYDLLNSTIAMTNAREEMALSLNGKKNNLKKNDIIDYLGKERLGLNENIINSVLQEFTKAIPYWNKLIGRSWLSHHMQEKYLALLNERYNKILF